MSHARSIVSGFTAQADSFNTSAVATDAGLLETIVDLAAPRRQERWLEAACGPGLIARRVAPAVAHVEGFDLTPAMIELARREATTAGLTNTTFTAGDVTALPAATDSFDGAVTRFSLHHIPIPSRVIDELRRVLTPGGKLILIDVLADPDPEAAAWAQEIERLRDPTHWASLTQRQLHALARDAGLTVEEERIVPIELDFDDWLARGEADCADQALVELALDRRPAGTTAFEVRAGGQRRILRLQMWLARLRR